MAENALIRIKKYLDYKGISMRAFEISVGFSNGAFASQLKNNKTIGVDRLENILTAYPDINGQWVLTGKGSMLIGSGHIVQEPIQPYGTKQNSLIPLLPVEAVAGFGAGEWAVTEKDIQDRYLVPDFNKIDFMIRVKGSSMCPKYSSGDIVACKKLQQESFIQWNKTHVISTKEQGIMVKRIKKSERDDSYLLVSDNKEYPPFDVPKDEITGIAIVIGTIRLE